MQIYSFIREGLGFEIVQVETSFLPGIPRIHLTGLPDQSMKESLLRVRTAILAGDFALPQRDQVIFHLRPGHVRKSSQGLDFAILMSYLLQSEQFSEMPMDSFLRGFQKIYFYGEIGLSGHVHLPEDIELIDLSKIPQGSLVVLGQPHSEHEQKSLQLIFSGRKDLTALCLGDVATFRNITIEDLRGMTLGAETLGDGDSSGDLVRPEILPILFSKEAATLMSVVATGEHSLFLVGPAGSGKTTFVESTYRLLRDPSDWQKREIRRMGKVFGLKPQWRPFVSPHHTTTSQAMIGGGLPPVPGDISRAHCGMLFLDEYLEFPADLKEALREPAEKKEITVSRKGFSRKFPADVQLISATNLCRCGSLVPGKSGGCGFSTTICRSYIRKMSGPMLDRFEIFGPTQNWMRDKKVPLTEIFQRVQKAVQFSQNVRGHDRPSTRMTIEEIVETMNPFAWECLKASEMVSERRRNATLRVARTIADLEGSKVLEGPHLEMAKGLTVQPFNDFRNLYH